MSPSNPLRAGTAARGGWLAPTPPSVAIEIASRRLTVAAVSGSAARPIVSAYASEPLPADAVSPALAGVNITSPGSVADALKRAYERAGIGSPRRAALIVPDSIARVSLVHFEQVPARPAELDQLIRWQLRKSTPFPLDDAIVAHIPASVQNDGATFAVIVARQDVVAQYEAVADAAGIHAGIVDLASLNVMNALIAANAARATGESPEDGDALLVCLAPEATTIAILRGSALLFYRRRAAIEEEPLSALVHQTAMYHEDRLGGTAFARAWLRGGALAERGGETARQEMTARLGVPVRAVDIRAAAALTERVPATSDVLDALAAPVGVLLRERPRARAARAREASPDPKAKAGAA